MHWTVPLNPKLVPASEVRAMGAGQSLPSQHQPPSKALHVLRVTPSSPASKTDIEPFFDFVVGFQGDALTNNLDAAELEKIVEAHEGESLNLVVWNSKNQESRVVPIVPSRAWIQSKTPTNGSDVKPSLLGLSVRMCESEFSLESVWHVLDVLEGSPAESAGLVPYGDWIIGWSGGVLSAEGDFYDIVESHVDKPLRVYVYSYDFDTIREVVLVPNRHWGGEGLLGCVFGFGLLHRIPPPPEDREPGTIPPELSESAEDFEEQQLFVPAEVPQPVPVSDDDDYPEWNQSFRSVHSDHSNYGENNDPLKPSPHTNGRHGHTVHIHDHDQQNGHDGHDYDHGEYDYESSASSSPQVTAIPFRLPSGAPISHSNSNTHLGFGIPRNMTPTQTRPLSGLRNSSGSYTNGDSRP